MNVLLIGEKKSRKTSSIPFAAHVLHLYQNPDPPYLRYFLHLPVSATSHNLVTSPAPAFPEARRGPSRPGVARQVRQGKEGPRPPDTGVVDSGSGWRNRIRPRQSHRYGNHRSGRRARLATPGPFAGSSCSALQRVVNIPISVLTIKNTNTFGFERRCFTIVVYGLYLFLIFCPGLNSQVSK